MLALHNMMIFEDVFFFMGFFFYSIDRLFLVIILKVSEYENMLVGTCGHVYIWYTLLLSNGISVF